MNEGSHQARDVVLRRGTFTSTSPLPPTLIPLTTNITSGTLLRLTESIDAREKGEFLQPMDVEENDSNIASPAPRDAESVEEREREGSHQATDLIPHRGIFNSTTPSPPTLILYVSCILANALLSAGFQTSLYSPALGSSLRLCHI